MFYIFICIEDFVKKKKKACQAAKDYELIV